jgi:hypothetical protein
LLCRGFSGVLTSNLKIVAMSDPLFLRSQASLIREMVGRSGKNRRAGASSYLLELANRFEHEALQAERRSAGQKPAARAVPRANDIPSRESIDLGPLVGRPHGDE